MSTQPSPGIHIADWYDVPYQVDRAALLQSNQRRKYMQLDLQAGRTSLRRWLFVVIDATWWCAGRHRT